MRKSGQITVFLSMVMLCICSLVCGLVESARTAGAGLYLKQAADSAIDSVFSRYHREVWDQYRLFLLEYGDPEELAEAWLLYMEPYTEEHGWYPAEFQSAAVNDISVITDEHGAYLKQEIQDYMRYGVWETVTEETGTENLWAELREAESLQAVSEVYSGHAKEAAELEKALEAIGKSLEQQEKYRKKAADRLSAWDGHGFRAAAKELKREIRRIPDLVKAYEKKADDLAAHLAETKEKISLKWEALSDSVRRAVETELASYEAYIFENGEKRLEIVSQIPKAADNAAAIGRAEIRSHEVEEEIEAWEEDEEGNGGPDEAGLWESVLTIWDGINISELSFRAGLKEPEKQNLLERIQKMVGLDLLRLVLPEEKTVSKGVIRTSGFPSVIYAENDLKDSFTERLLTDEYIGRFFTSFLSEEEKAVLYEQEYILGGKSTDEENLKYTVSKVLALREGLNLIHILSDSQKRAEARTLAAAITGITGAAPLTGIAAFFIMTVWALGEAVADLKSLLKGGCVPLIKTRETWRLDLDDLLALGEQGELAGSGESGTESGNGVQNGMNRDYNGYLKLLMFIEPAERLYYRIMDMIQLNIARKQPGFSMDRCVYQMEIRGMGVGKHLFWLGSNPRYPIEVHTDKAY